MFSSLAKIRSTSCRRFFSNISRTMDSNDKDKLQSWTSSISDKGEYVRKASVFRNWVTANGSTGFKADSGRYHLYVSLACPWAHRCLIVRKLKGLEAAITYTVVDWVLTPAGWSFTDKKPHCTLDTINNCALMKDVYRLVNPEYNGNVTVPVLWDKQKGTIVNNESSEIIRMLNTEFNAFCTTDKQREIDLYPESLRAEIDQVNEWIYPNINNGVYRSGFAQTQEAYDTAVRGVFNSLDRVEGLLTHTRYLTGSQLTEADVRLFTTLVRFDMVYVGHFKCNKKRIVDYPCIWAYVRDIYQTDGISETVDAEHIMKHYQVSHRNINPLGIVAIGPDLDFTLPHGRDQM